ncbi:deoxyribose-phosphate aldolase [Tannockella kyphosi]|uniref:deoxyribose-phosphate aldolase n=1 Tax=Tannockella kyphosi TaxID=2899121 RepID=UPI00201393A4|nr:deoxyribose-phosphate aldolase [Tannockella kyphosi]
MNYSGMIDHTALKPDTTKEQITQLCKEAKEFHFASVCVNPTWIQYCATLLEATEVKVCTVIGFPLGANTSATKAFETTNAIENGANEIDMVINIGALKDGNTALVKADIEAVVEAAKGTCVKVIIETCLLTKEEIVTVCTLAKEAKATFVKTSTGFSTGGATVEDVALMKQTVGEDLEVKASGGVRTFEDMENVVKAGASRIGTSSGCKLVNKEVSTSEY